MSRTRHGNGFRWSLGELSGALGDLGTLLPLMLGAIAVAGLAAGPVVAGFGLAYVATAAVYRLPVPVQPMKAVAAVLLASGMGPAEVAASGVMLGLALLALGAGGLAERLARAVPQSVLAGLQLGLGLSLGFVALGLMAEAPGVAAAVLAVLALCLALPGAPAALLALAVAVLAGQAAGIAAPDPAPGGALWALPPWPTAAEAARAVTGLVLPQLSLTLTNAVALTALVAGDCFGGRAAHVTPRRLALTSGAGNLLLAPLGALPMCHGAGGLAAHHRFGARTGAAPLMIGLGLLALAAVPGGIGLLAAVPEAGLGALLLAAAVELAASRRLLDARPSCRPVIAVAAGAVIAAGPFAALLAGLAAEALRVAILRRRGADA